MIAFFGLVFVVMALTRSIRRRFFLGAATALVVGYASMLAFVESTAALRESGNPIAVLAILVIGRTALPHEGVSMLPLRAAVGRFPLAANVASIFAALGPFALLELRTRRLHPDSSEAQRITPLSNAFLAVALVDALLLGIGLLARALMHEGV